ncbi:KIN14F [Symbiodinium sp. CCMP2592]|nr:KIN14F [Symbiodinium sp. CCMP2592]
MVFPLVRSPGKRLESTPEKENSFAGSWNLDLGRFQRKCAEISASLSQPSLGDRIRAETARSGDAPLPSTSTVLQGEASEAWSPSLASPAGERRDCSERSPLQDCTVQAVQVQSPARAPPAAASPVPCKQFRSPGSPLAAKAAVQLVPSPSVHPMHPVPARWCLPEFEDLRRKMQHSISALQRSNAQQAEMQAALSQALQRGESFKEEAQEARRSKDRHHHKWCALDQEREALQRAAQAAQAAERAARGAERAALEEAAAWRRWLASFLDVLLRRGTQSHLQADVSASQCFEERQPKLHSTLQQLSQLSERPSLEPGLLAEMSDLYAWLAGVMGENRLSVIWNDGHEEQQKADDRVAQLERKLAQKEIAVASLEHEKRALRSEVRTLQNLVQELRGSIRVFCRIRPPKQPAGSLAGAATEAQGARSISLRKPAGDKRQDFSFDRVFSQLAGQRDLYEEVEPLIPGVLQGIHVCILAYGQTGAGKTYTLAGDRSTGEPGIQDLAIADLLKLALGSSEGARYDVRLSALEIYNESIQDLLSDPETGLREGLQEGPCERLEVRQSREAGPASEEAAGSWPSPFGSMRVPGLKSWAVRESSDVEQALGRIGRQRHVASTALNERSSRSHCVLSLSVRAAGGAGDDEGHRGCGVLHIVDLAGSERTKVSQAEGQQMKEANCINRSLSALSDVLSALGDSSGNAHIPFRNSKLTYLLQDALGGPGCKTFLFAQVSPEVADANESYSTLTFASRVAANVQKGRLRPMSRQGPPGGSPATRAQDASPRLRSQDSEPSLASPVLRARGVAPPLPGLGRKR